MDIWAWASPLVGLPDLAAWEGECLNPISRPFGQEETEPRLFRWVNRNESRFGVKVRSCQMELLADRIVRFQKLIPFYTARRENWRLAVVEEGPRHLVDTAGHGWSVRLISGKLEILEEGPTKKVKSPEEEIARLGDRVDPAHPLMHYLAARDRTYRLWSWRSRLLQALKLLIEHRLKTAEVNGDEPDDKLIIVRVGELTFSVYNGEVKLVSEVIEMTLS